MNAVDFDLIPIPVERVVRDDQWTPPADIRIISADDHNLEIDHLFEQRLPATFQDRAPKFWRDAATGGVHIRFDGKNFDLPGLGNIGFSCPGFWDRDERLKAMDSEAISASVLYPGQATALNALIGLDPELYIACMEVYNEWLAEYCDGKPDRLVGVAVLPAFLKPETARDHMKKIKALGYRTLQMPSFPRGVRYNSREMDPVWEAIVESGMPLSFHVTGVQEFSGHGSLGANIARNLSPFRPLLGQLIFSGVFERHPDLQVVFAEGGAFWVADALYSMDRTFRSYYSILRPQLSELPSYYWHKNCYATFMDDPLAMEMCDRIGAERMMWSLDFPHPEGVFGYAGDVAKNIYDTVGHDKAKLILGGTAARLYHL